MQYELFVKVCRIWSWQHSTEHWRVRSILPDLFFPCRLQKVQVEVFKKLLQRREENQNELDAMRLYNHWQNHQNAKEEKIRKIRCDCALSKSERQEERGRDSFQTSHLYFLKVTIYSEWNRLHLQYQCAWPASIWSVMFLFYLRKALVNLQSYSFYRTVCVNCLTFVFPFQCSGNW